MNEKTSKSWILMLVTYYATEFLEKRYGVKIDEMGLNLIADIIQYGSVALVAWLNRKRLLPPQHPFEGVSANAVGQNQSATGDHGPMV